MGWDAQRIFAPLGPRRGAPDQSPTANAHTEAKPPGLRHATPMEKPSPAPRCLTVLYDGSCPLCRREVGVYRGLPSSQPIAWQDVSEDGTQLPGNGQRQTYMARFHVQQADGTLLSGAAAFVALWATLPGWRWLAKLAALPGATPLMEWLYCRFLVVRPWLQKAVVALDKPQGSQ